MIEEPFARLGLMGGCGSSGTTLLVHLLSRCQAIGSGPEFNCFNRPELYDLPALRFAWSEIRRGRAKPAGYIDVPVFMTHREHYRITDDLIELWMSESSNASQFVGRLKEHLHRTLACQIVLEKSPTNVYCFRIATAALPGVKIIHLMRDGRDVVVSLMRRGFSLFGAGSRWLYDTVRAIEARDAPGYVEAKYEELVANPDAICERLLAHLGADQLLDVPVSDGGRPGLYTEQWTNRAEPRAWNQTPSDPISNRSVGQFRDRLSKAELVQLNRIRLRSNVAVRGDLPRQFGELLEYLGYENLPGHQAPQERQHDCLRLELGAYVRRLRRFHNRSYWRFPQRFTYFAD